MKPLTTSERYHGEFFTIKEYAQKICKKKQCYKSESIALKNAIKLRKNKGYHVHPYYCDSCGWWHLGHDSLDRKIEDGTFQGGTEDKS